jgi:quercetin dioxygenase-like cupin family protein
MEKRVFENPLIKDKVTFIRTSQETNGAYTLVEVELKEGGGNGMHYHGSFTEEFIPIEGELGIDLGKQKLRLQPGEKAVAQKGEMHRFYNPGNQTIRFHVKLTPGWEGFENGLKIAYGLAADNKTNKSGVPKSMTHLGLIVHLTDTCLPGFLSLIQPLLKWKAKQAIKKGIDKQLISQYA